MKKVIYSITKIGKTENTKTTGVGYITDTELITANIAKSGKAYIRVYDCVKYCQRIGEAGDEYRGLYSELVEYEGRDIEIAYYIWYKVTKD